LPASSREKLLSLYDRLESLVKKLPGGIQKPILSELGPIRNIYLSGKTARLALVGGEEFSEEELLRKLSDAAPQRGATIESWTTWALSGQRELLVADLRPLTAEAAATRLAQSPADQFLMVVEGDITKEQLAAKIGKLSEIVRELTDRGAQKTSLLVMVNGSGREVATVAAAVAAHPVVSALEGHVVSFEHREAAINAASEILPDHAQLEYVRFMGAKKAQARIGKSILTSFSAVCGVIGVQPIPLADMPILVTLQMLMVSLIVYASGRKIGPKVIAEFMGALGINVGAGYAFREGARALVKVLPFWGNAISGFVAGAGTYAIGRAAIAYFIEKAPAKETRKLFKSLKPKRLTFRRKSLPPPGE